jgi:hypothetical protein
MPTYGRPFLLSSNTSRRCKISRSKVRSMTRTRKIIMVDHDQIWVEYFFVNSGAGSDANVAFLFLLM